MCSGDPLGIVGYGDQNGSHQPLFLFFYVPYNTGTRVGLCWRPLHMVLIFVQFCCGLSPFGIIVTPGTKARTGYGEIHAI
jgi:hypothetical protein